MGCFSPHFGNLLRYLCMMTGLRVSKHDRKYCTGSTVRRTKMPEQTDPTSSQATPHSTDPFEEAYRNYLRAMKDAWAQYDVDAVNLRPHPMLPFGQAVPGLPCAPGHIAVNCR